jgi:hypothetical protein
MAHFAQLDENNTVIAVNVIADADCLDGDGNESEAVGIAFCQSLWGADTNWKQTSYNTKAGKRWNADLTENTGTPQFRKNYAQLTYTYDASKDAFIQAKPYASWVLDDATCLYNPPIAYPVDSEGDEIPGYRWDESIHQGDNTKGWVFHNE